MNLELSIIDYTSPIYSEVLLLRQQVLRKPLGLDLFSEDLSDEKNQYIVIAKNHDTIIGCLLIKIIDQITVKFRQMAVDPMHQHKGVGQIIIGYAENFCLLNEYSSITLHARISAQKFYTKLNYQSQGELFEEVGIPHIFMYKNL